MNNFENNSLNNRNTYEHTENQQTPETEVSRPYTKIEPPQKDAEPVMKAEGAAEEEKKAAEVPVQEAARTSYTNTVPSWQPSQSNGQAYHNVSQPTPPASSAAGYGAPAQQAAPRPSYTWNNQPNMAPQGPYGQPPKKKKSGKKAGKTVLKVVAGVLCCAVISAGSVGAFAGLIQNGTIQIASSEDSSNAAFTLYKKADTPETSTVATVDDLTPQQVAEKVIPSVVSIQNYQNYSQQDFFLDGFNTEDGSSQLTPTSEGSGIIISKDGYIATNEHVVSGASSLKVVTSDGRTYEAELIGSDTQTDLAVIKITTEDELTPAEFATSSDLKVADEVMAIGNPGGLTSSVTVGYISALDRDVTNSETGYTVSCIQTDAAINPGNSGGALVDMNGFVIGINSSKIVSTSYEGLGFAIPSDTVQPVLSDLIEYGYVKDRPMLGITGLYIDRMTASYYGLSQGFVVAEVVSEEAKASGLKMYDVITAIDDTQVTSQDVISTYIADKKPGDKVKLTVVKSSTGKETTIELALSENTGTGSSTEESQEQPYEESQQQPEEGESFQMPWNW